MRRRFFIIFIVLFIFLVKPELLHAFDTLSGRILMLLVTVYLATLNVVLGFTAAVVMVRVLDSDPFKPMFMASPDLLHLESLIRPRDSAWLPTLRTTDVPINDGYEPYTYF
jgi:hypothetical protein